MLFAVFVIGPIVELAVLIKVGAAIGVLNTVGLLVLSGVLGSWLAKRAGLSVLRRVQDSIAAGRVPAAEMVDGLLVLFGGALMIAPGFVTDVLGMSLMLPPVRAVVRRTLRKRFEMRIEGTAGPGGPGIIDLP